MRGNEVYGRIGPADGGKRSFGPLRRRRLPDDLFGESDAEQDAIGGGDWNDDLGVWQGDSAGSKATAGRIFSIVTRSTGGRSAATGFH